MASKKYDGVVEAVRYAADGQVAWVRAYLRRGPIFTDYMLIPRGDLVERLKAGQIFVIGDRIHLMANSFNVRDTLRLEHKNGQDVLLTGRIQDTRDRLESVPLV